MGKYMFLTFMPFKHPCLQLEVLCGTENADRYHCYPLDSCRSWYIVKCLTSFKHLTTYLHSSHLLLMIFAQVITFNYDCNMIHIGAHRYKLTPSLSEKMKDNTTICTMSTLWGSSPFKKSSPDTKLRFSWFILLKSQDGAIHHVLYVLAKECTPRLMSPAITQHISLSYDLVWHGRLEIAIKTSNTVQVYSLICTTLLILQFSVMFCKSRAIVPTYLNFGLTFSNIVSGI